MSRDMEIEVSVDKSEVLDEVGRLTAYTGQRKEGDAGVYERISSTSGDADMLEQFWQASCSAMSDNLKPFIKELRYDYETYEYSSSNINVNPAPISVSHTGYYVKLELSGSYDTSLTGSMMESMKNFFICMMSSKWFKITSHDDAQSYADDAAGYMTDIMRKIYFKKKPSRRPSL